MRHEYQRSRPRSCSLIGGTSPVRFCTLNFHRGCNIIDNKSDCIDGRRQPLSNPCNKMVLASVLHLSGTVIVVVGHTSCNHAIIKLPPVISTFRIFIQTCSQQSRGFVNISRHRRLLVRTNIFNRVDRLTLVD